jgi:glycine cleavage system regulatory protein
MHKKLVMTLMGKDHTGLVESLARMIADHGGNWLESRMCRLGGEFAGILSASVPEDQVQTLSTSLQKLHAKGLTIVIHHDETASAPLQTKTATLNLVGHDRPGIIYQLSAALANQNINVEELETECSSAPMSGEMIFKASARLQIPEGCAISGLRKELEDIGSELMVDISFTEL